MTFDPSSLLDASHLVAFLGGTAVGAAGTYLADRLTDQRRKQETSKEDKARFSDLRKQMPAFLDEVGKDLQENPELSIREFVVLPNERITFIHDRPRFQYYEAKYPGIVNHISLLVEAGYVEVLRSTGTPIYRLRESLVANLRS